jgi:MFS family permease
MYTQLREGMPSTGTEGKGGRPIGRWVSANVLALGFTSMVTDISSEMVTAVLPLYFVFFLQLDPLSFGIIDGLYHGVAALVRVASGVLSDRWGRYKEIAGAGYGLSAVAKLGLLAAGNFWAGVVGVILVDRVGKGMRTSPRDALISLSTPREKLGTAFGVHRAMDTAGALAGPLVAFAILMAAPGAFDAIFVTSFFVAIIGVAILVLFVRNRTAVRTTGEGPPSLRSAAGLLRDRPFRRLVIVGGVLSLMTLSDGFLYLVLQRQLNINLGLFPLLYVATAVVYLVLAVPVGRLADTVGRGRVFVAGYVLLAGVYLVLLTPGLGSIGAVLAILMFGSFYAATDGVLMAMTSAVLPESLRTSGLGVLTTVTSLGRLGASVLFGALWAVLGQTTAVIVVLGGLVLSLAIAGMLIDVRRRPARA